MLRAVALATAEATGAIPETEKGQPNGVATLDAGGKIPTSEMPVGDVTYKGNWSAATNTPTLADGVGTAGDLHICDVAGTQNLGGGDVAYSVGDWLIYDGSVWDRVPGAGAAPANPTGLVGTAAVNGAAATFMRSDAAPAINQAMVPTWTGAHTFNGGITVNESGAQQVRIINNNQFTGPAAALTISGNSSNGPGLGIGNTSQGADGKWWDFIPVANALNFRINNDAGNASKSYFTITRSANTVQSISFGNGTDNPAYLWAGSGPWTVAGSTGSLGQVLTSTGNATAPAWSTPLPTAVASTALINQSADASDGTLYAVPADGTYRASCYVVLTRAATTSATLPSCSVNYTDLITNVAMTSQAAQSATGNVVGTHIGGVVVFEAKSGTNIGFATTGYASSGATTMQYRVRVVIERLV